MTLKQREFRPDSIGPLHGLRVIDLSRLVCGNTLTALLADYGADVIKVEPPAGDPLRAWKTAGVETHWKSLGRNKRSLCLNLRRPQAVALLLDVISSSDVVIESFRPGVLEEMGLAPETLLAQNPRLVVVRISGWGQSGPYRQKPGFGTLVEGMSGFASMTGFADREPLLPPIALADSVAGYCGAFAVLVALRHAEQGHGGQVIDLPLFDPLFAMLGPQAANFRLTGDVKQRSGSRSTISAPRNVYCTRDGKWLSLSASTQAMAERLFRAMGRPELIDDPKYKDNASRVANAAEIDEVVRTVIARLDRDEAMALFEAAEVTVAPVYDIGEVMDDPHFTEREVIVELPDEDMGAIPMHGIVPRLEKSPGAFFRPAPRLGQHSLEVLRSLGMPQEKIARLCGDATVIDGSSTERGV